MRYTVVIAVTTSSTTGSPVSGSVALPVGVIRNAAISFGTGVNGAVKARVLLGSTQIFPSEVGTDYVLFNSPLTIKDEYPNRVASTLLYLKGFANGSSYPHTLMLSCNVEAFDQPEI
jgi:hypothetical protein